MAGIILLSLLLIAFVVYCVLIYLPIRWAKKRGIAERKRFYIGVASFVVVSALFFGKNLVSYTAFKYYCKNEAGLTVYKTLDQWKAENPGVWETLRPVGNIYEYAIKEQYPYENVPYKKFFDGKEYKASSRGNQRIVSYVRYEYKFWGALSKDISIIFDNKEQKILAIYNNYRWTNTWDTVPDKDGWRGRSYLGNISCRPDRWEFSDYAESFSNFNLIQKDEENE